MMNREPQMSLAARINAFLRGGLGLWNQSGKTPKGGAATKVSRLGRMLHNNATAKHQWRASPQRQAERKEIARIGFRQYRKMRQQWRIEQRVQAATAAQ